MLAVAALATAALAELVGPITVLLALAGSLAALMILTRGFRRLAPART